MTVALAPAARGSALQEAPPAPGESGPLGAVGDLLGLVPPRYWVALGVVLVGVVLYVAVDRSTVRLLDRLGVRSAVEGTAFERTAREFDTSTVDLIAAVLGYFVFGMAIIVALTVAQVDFADPFWSAVAAYLPRLFVATVVVIVGVVVGDKLDVVVAERLQDVKLPQVSLLPRLVKYSVVYVAVLVALAQLEVATLALVVLLAGYLLALIVFGGIASGALLASSAAGAYLLLNEPYAIGDEIRVDDVQGIVSEMDLFVTHVESDDEEYILPNRKVFRHGVVRVRG